MARMLIVLLVLLTFGSISLADCGVYNTYQPTYTPYKETVVEEVAVPIAVPVIIPATVFQYLPALQPAAVVAQPTAVAAAPAVHAQPTNSAADVDRLIKERIDYLLRERLAAVNGDGGPPPLILPSDLAHDAPRPDASPTADLTQNVANMLASKSCVNCHTAGGDKPVKGNVTLFVRKDNQLFFQPSVDKGKIVAAVTPDSFNQTRMPPDGPTLQKQELELVKTWKTK